MLSVVSQTITARRMKEALSLAAGSEVKNRNTIRQATAKAAGFESFEQAVALCSRSERIWESVWIEREMGAQNKWVVRAVNAEIIIGSAEGVIWVNSHSENVSYITLPPELKGYQFTGSDIEYCPKFKKIVMRATGTEFSIVFQRAKDKLYIGIHGKESIEPQSLTFEKHDYDAVDSWLDDFTQPARLLAECIMICDESEGVAYEAMKQGVSGDDFKAACDTALWLFEKSKGYEGEIVDELEPKGKFKKAMGFLAHLFLEHYYNGNVEATEALCQSTGFDAGMLRDSRCRAKAEADWFLFSYCG